MSSLFFPISLLFIAILYGGAVLIGGFLLGFAFRKGWDAASPRPPRSPS